jgi:hypothetical protein
MLVWYPPRYHTNQEIKKRNKRNHSLIFFIFPGILGKCPSIPILLSSRTRIREPKEIK